MFFKNKWSDIYLSISDNCLLFSLNKFFCSWSNLVRFLSLWLFINKYIFMTYSQLYLVTFYLRFILFYYSPIKIYCNKVCLYCYQSSKNEGSKLIIMLYYASRLFPFSMSRHVDFIPTMLAKFPYKTFVFFTH